MAISPAFGPLISGSKLMRKGNGREAKLRSRAPWAVAARLPRHESAPALELQHAQRTAGTNEHSLNALGNHAFQCYVLRTLVEPVSPEASRADAIAEALRAQILSGKYEAGERLPSERELALRLGGSRGSAREALKQLEQEGMITIRRGDGARVRPLEEAGLNALHHLLASSGLPREGLVSQWLDVQELVIAGGARFAVERANDEERARGKQLLRRLARSDTTNTELIAIIDQLTELIAIASRNLVLRMVRNALRARKQGRPKRRVRTGPERRALAQMARAVERALDERDADAVEASVRALLRAARAAILERVAQP